MSILPDTIYIATGTIPDGYYGKRQSVEFRYHTPSGKVLCFAHCGYFTSQCPPASSVKEALWLLNNHPSCESVIID